MGVRTVLIVLTGLMVLSCEARPVENPPLRQAALALTYDDAMPSQLDKAVPQLDAYDFKATFYVSLSFEDFENRRSDWSKLAAEGHELGNHTLIHPCQGSKPGRDWVTPNRDLDLYSQTRLLEELAAANDILFEIDGRSQRTFAYPCGDTSVGGASYIGAITKMFSGARSVDPSAPFTSFFVPSLAVDNTSAEDMIAYVNGLITDEKVGTITFHGIGEGHLPVSEEAHEELLNYLDQKRDEIWVAPLDDILNHIRARDGETDGGL